MDLLLSVDWAAQLMGRAGDALEIQPLVGLSTLMAAQNPEAVPQGQGAATPVLNAAPLTAVATPSVASGGHVDSKQSVVGISLLWGILLGGSTIVAVSVLLALYIMRHLPRE